MELQCLSRASCRPDRLLTFHIQPSEDHPWHRSPSTPTPHVSHAGSHSLSILRDNATSILISNTLSQERLSPLARSLSRDRPPSLNLSLWRNRLSALLVSPEKRGSKSPDGLMSLLVFLLTTNDQVDYRKIAQKKAKTLHTYMRCLCFVVCRQVHAVVALHSRFGFPRGKCVRAWHDLLRLALATLTNKKPRLVTV